MAGFFKGLLAQDKLIRVFCSGRMLHPVSIQLFAAGRRLRRLLARC